jgi:hypothetical protein
MSVHIFTAATQPLVRHKVDLDLGAPPHTVTVPKHRRVRCHFCGRLREARNLLIQVYYDKVHVFCGTGGCSKR